MATVEFQRARQPAQVAARRAMILQVARAMLGEQAVADISLRELSARVGLAKSNVLRYFESREAIFLEILDEEWKSWLDSLEEPIAEVAAAEGDGFSRHERTAGLIARSLAGRPLLGDLIGVMSSVLERNITAEFAADFRGRATANTARLSAMVREVFPALPAEQTDHAAGATFFLVAGLWPSTRPADALAAGVDPGALRDQFVADFAEGLTNLLAGLTVRYSA